ncbi:YdeI/OmpD-associated family protein [Candidatus Formimonas warabiya]
MMTRIGSERTVPLLPVKGMTWSDDMNDQIMFENRERFRKWLSENHNSNKGIWLLFSKTSKVKTIKPDEALEEALCFGWIDGQVKSINEDKYVKKFSPRRKESRWSEKNRNLANVLIETGKMTEHGLAAITEARRRGTWDIPRNEPINEKEIEILIKALSGTEKALFNFLNMPMSVKKTYTGFYLDAKKEETRIKRLEKIIERLNENKKPM